MHICSPTTKIKNQKSFQEDNDIFSRTKYEKFLLENNLTSVEFEQEVKNNELKKVLKSSVDAEEINNLEVGILSALEKKDMEI